MARFRLKTLLVIAVSMATPLLIAGCGSSDSAESGATETVSADGVVVPEIPKCTVKFGHEPYGDHTQSIIGVRSGWFEEVGISFEPADGTVVSSENVVPYFASGQVDVLSGSVPLLLAASKELPDFKYFFHADAFLGYALMAQPDAGYKSAKEFEAEGLSSDEALAKAVGQMKGKRFGYPAENAIKGFINLTLKKGGLTLDDTVNTIAEDSKTSALMIGDQLDFQVGGVPSRLTLESEGFKPIVTSADLAAAAKPSVDSEELLAIFHDGWGATDEWIDANYDCMLRLTSVGFRINDLINNDMDAAIALHQPFLNQAAGTDISTETFKVIYQSLDPFLTFEQQNDWYNNPEFSMAVEYVVGAHIKSAKAAGQVDESKTLLEFTNSKEVYDTLVELKASSETKIAEAKGLVTDSTPQAKELLAQAEKFYAGRDYLDADRFAQAAIDAVAVEAG
jgi:ABC-type nitrate/sulfonate/bicarbonate transport system substrate-binding protein